MWNILVERMVLTKMLTVITVNIPLCDMETCLRCTRFVYSCIPLETQIDVSVYSQKVAERNAFSQVSRN